MSQTPPDPAPSEESGDWFTRARHIFYGTAATFIEMLEDPQKREENWGKMSMDIHTLADELAAKGQFTEAEALRHIQEQQQQPQQPQQPQPQSHSDQGAPPSASRSSDPDSRDRSPANPTPPGRSQSDPQSPAQTSSATSSSRSTPPAPQYPTDPAPQSGEPVSAEDISALMELTREVERLRRDLEQRRIETSND